MLTKLAYLLIFGQESVQHVDVISRIPVFSFYQPTMLFELQGFIHKALLANHLYEAEAVEFVTACKNNSLFVTKSAFERNDMMIFLIFLLPLKNAISRIPKKQTLTSFLFNSILPLFNTW